MGSLAAVFGLSLLDSLNPSALLVTVFLLVRGGGAVRVGTYVAAIFSTYLLLGVLLMSGMTTLAALTDHPVVDRVGHALMAVGGLAMLGYALFAPSEPARPARRRLPAANLALPAVFALGVTITLVEFVTALPYLGALGILTAGGFAVAVWLPVLIGYNLVFVLPPVLLLVLWRVAGHRVRPRFEGYLDKQRDRGRTLLLWGLGLVGFFLARQGIFYYLVLFGVVRP
ncbi:GAP family protein [Goodfellowiella coeruleoviolacea]|uniref:Sap, sulfolipid-1-addressing protein n=1 Tax=Goodfellowiella coeruleoviolacea TaxID=334858 RepID=A0AAE3GHN2_9PSEU|nr:GAP family protein [Goodfellowiella coeruleoviolacea]MCP2166303.1 Sap, sulfolipid-1-addressing protein [Goodfellowiella coeruleoviolacea]